MQAQDKTDILTAFFHTARSDIRLTHTHMSVYFALYQYYIVNDYQNPFRITRSEIMGYAKVSIATYHKCIADLHSFGYINYNPSYHPAKGSIVHIYSIPTKPSL